MGVRNHVPFSHETRSKPGLITAPLRSDASAYVKVKVSENVKLVYI